MRTSDQSRAWRRVENLSTNIDQRAYIQRIRFGQVDIADRLHSQHGIGAVSGHMTRIATDATAVSTLGTEKSRASQAGFPSAHKERWRHFRHLPTSHFVIAISSFRIYDSLN
ncbi:hypothetical protein [Aminobacter sp. SS-2016]|uniref:hypothetical protein n=1 Tax=Aminobacter sp. Y103A TaxID=1870862 RepID=UPI002573B08C|nr:hypothetical protein [Aminobacter sp. SS-2016]